MAHKNFRMLWDNRAFDAASLAATSSASGYPVTCLQDPFRSRKWRSTQATGQSIAIDFGSSIDFNSLAFIDHNLMVTGTIRITASDTPGGSDKLDMTVDAFNPLIGFGEGGFGDFGFGGSLLEIDRSWVVPNPVRTVYNEDDDGGQIMVTARYVTIEFTEATANPDQYIELGRIFIGRYADFGFNFSGITHGFIEESEKTRSLGGQAWITKKAPLRRTIELTFDALQYLDKYWNLKFMIEKMGLTGSYVIDCFPSLDHPSQNHHSILYGGFQDLPAIERTRDMGFLEGLQLSNTSIVFEEEIA